MSKPRNSPESLAAPGLPAWRHPMFVRGLRDYAPISIGIAAWGLVAGVAMLKSGLPVPVAILMSLLVFAGSAQLTALPLIAVGAPVWVIWGAAVCVNLRFVIFSAQWRPYFGHLPRRKRVALSYFSGDTMYAMFMRRFPEERPAGGQVPYFWGAALANWATWQVSSIVGILVGAGIPPSWGLGFAGTMALLGLSCGMVRSWDTAVAAMVGACAAVAAYALPLRLNIVVAIAAAVATGITIEHARRRSPR